MAQDLQATPRRGVTSRDLSALYDPGAPPVPSYSGRTLQGRYRILRREGLAADDQYQQARCLDGVEHADQKCQARASTQPLEDGLGHGPGFDFVRKPQSRSMSRQPDTSDWSLAWFQPFIQSPCSVQYGPDEKFSVEPVW